ncbi:MAG: bifunctional isocitrate dehydrogenase kinase/phosphatase [Acidimicrobiia bacterium]|nr:bifunctional isocitrate dehydrogenase kinase/phosphatase [Acidimicrobiia bacterium]
MHVEPGLVEEAADLIRDRFVEYTRRFGENTARSQARFEERDWAGAHADAVERLELYPAMAGEARGRLGDLLGSDIDNRELWAAIKASYSTRLADRDVWEIGETFYNSVTRLVFVTTGVDPQVEFVSTDFLKPPTRPQRDLYYRYDRAASAERLVEAVLTDFRFGVLYEDIRRDARRVGGEIEALFEEFGEPGLIERAEVVSAVFYREQGAYLVGRLYRGVRLIPFVLALRNRDDAVVVDAVLLDEEAVSILFSFTRSHFHVAAERPFELVRFLRTLMPRKRPSELYSSIGFHKHAKTELFREILEHLATTDARFEYAPGARGLVMVVFTMPDLDLVFKMLRDRFGAPKKTTPRSVKEKYDLVFKHDRAGRLIDAHSFEHLQLERRHFADDLLEGLTTECANTVRVAGDTVVIDHAYIERRVTPLDVHVRSVSVEEATPAVVDYGRAIKDLAASNVFPGDLLLKNFGLTRHGRVVFYDYDELMRLEECVFRELPEPAEGDEMAEIPLFGVGPDDLFPEEFRSYLGMPKLLREVFEREHADLFAVPYWREIQLRLESGDLIEVLPYAEEERLT